MDRNSILERFRKDTLNHQMAIRRDDGLYRHLRFQTPGTWCYGFDIITWPGFLAITGDMGEALFTRTEDMLEFFRVSQEWQDKHPGELYINRGYWLEKCKASDCSAMELSDDNFRNVVKERYDDYIAEHLDENDKPPAWASELWEEIEGRVLYRDRDGLDFALAAMHDFETDDDRYRSFGFTDVGEYARSVQEYTFHFTWRLFAIAHAVKSYDAFKAASASAVAVEVGHA